MSVLSAAIRSPFHCPRHSHTSLTGVLVACPSPPVTFTTRVSIDSSVETADSPNGASSLLRHYTRFQLSVNLICSICGTDTWQIHHRYSDFETLHSDLQREQSDSPPTKTRLPPLPPSDCWAPR